MPCCGSVPHRGILFAVSAVQSVERAFAILRCLAGGPAGVSEVAERVALPKSTVSRLLSTMQSLGVVAQTGSSNEYRIGEALVDLASATLPGRSLVAAARPLLAELVETLDEVAGLSVLDVNDVVYLDQVSTDHQVQVRDWTGERIPAHLASSGLVLLAAMDEADVERYLAGPLAASSGDVDVDPHDLRRRLATVAADGFVWAEYLSGVSSVAAPVFGPDGRALAAVHVHGPSYRFPDPGEAERIAALLVAAARRIGARLGGAAPALAS